MIKRFAVIGDPVAHSLSPFIHSQWMEAHDLDASYTRLKISDGAFYKTLKALSLKGYCGFNVTLPHKARALDFADQATERARSIGAANTLSFDVSNHIWSADNTDAAGFLSALSERIDPQRLQTMRFIVLGAGGAARAIVYALRSHAERLVIINRTVDKARTLSDALTQGRARIAGFDQLAQNITPQTVLINTTSAGHFGSLLSLPEEAGALFYDISYGTAACAQLQQASSRGWDVLDGLSMLVGQAAESFFIWFGIRPDIGAAVSECRETLKDV